jgi:hypothetical protein
MLCKNMLRLSAASQLSATIRILRALAAEY